MFCLTNFMISCPDLPSILPYRERGKSMQLCSKHFLNFETRIINASSATELQTGQFSIPYRGTSKPSYFLSLIMAILRLAQTFSKSIFVRQRLRTKVKDASESQALSLPLLLTSQPVDTACSLPSRPPILSNTRPVCL